MNSELNIPRLLLASLNRRAALFALKGVIAMALALYLAMSMQLERPYWALISAVFLQLRPETGLVIQKGIYQILGTLVGGAAGLAILAWLLPYPGLAIITLALWVAFHAGASAWVRQSNLVYGFAMAGITASLIVLLSVANPLGVDNLNIFHVAYARVTELVLGSLCAILVSSLLWPEKVGILLRDHARQSLNQTLQLMQLELDPASTRAARHGQMTLALMSTLAMQDDSSGAYYEGPAGPAQARAATLICHKILSLISRLRMLGQLQRYHGELFNQELQALLEVLRNGFQQLLDASQADSALQQAQRLRQQLRQLNQQQSNQAPDLQRRIFQVSLELSGDLIVALEANHALHFPNEVTLRPQPLAPYRDSHIAASMALRSGLLFLLSAGLWVGTASPQAILMMVMPVVFSIMFARLPIAAQVSRMTMFSAFLALPVVLFVALPLLALANGNFPLLILVMGVPMFLALMAMSQRLTLPLGLGFALPFVVLLQPGNAMTFNAAQAVNSGLAICLAMVLLTVMFRLIPPPGGSGLGHRLVRQTGEDLELLARPHPQSQEWFFGRMAERLLKLSGCDQVLAQEQRHFTDLGLTALNLGQASLWLQNRLSESANSALLAQARRWQLALAHAFLASSRGQPDSSFHHHCAQLVEAMARADDLAPQQRSLIHGALERMLLSLERLAEQANPAAALTPLAQNK